MSDVRGGFGLIELVDQMRAQTLAQFGHDARMADERGGIETGEFGREPLTRGDVRPRERGEIVVVVSADHGVGDDRRALRAAPVRTQVLLLSLKSSTRRPANSMPRAGSAGSARRTALPMRKKPFSSNAAAVNSG